jgi:hypothetical protein
MKDNSNKVSFLRKIFNVPIGLTLGTSVFAVSSLRAVANTAVNGVKGLAGAGVTFLATSLHLLNFAKFQTIKGWQKIVLNKVDPNLNVNSTAKMVTNAMNFTSKSFNDAKNSTYNVFSGKADASIKKAVAPILGKMTWLPNTGELFKKAAQITLSIPGKEKSKDKSTLTK